MRQVPCYLIIGNGRVARHFRAYFDFLKIAFLQWHRGMPIELLYHYQQQATHILVLISDDAIDAFIQNNLSEAAIPIIHFSGSLSTELAYGAHPLNTFGNELYELGEYQAIPFIIDADAPDFDALLPGLPNSHVRIAKNQKAKYHALCVLAGNMSCLLWQKLMTEFNESFHWPRSIANTYLKRQMFNLLEDPEHALTGPLVRKDKQTIARNKAALNDDPFQAVFNSFVDYYEQSRGES